MNRTELARALAEEAGFTVEQATAVVEALFDPEDGIVARGLQESGRVQITGFGTFETRTRKARTGRNPRTGASIRIPASRTAGFRVGKGLKDAIAHHHGDPTTDPPPPEELEAESHHGDPTTDPP